MNNILKLSIIVVLCLVSLFAYNLWKTVDLGEELPVTIAPENIVWGAIRAYHPDLFYRKYRINFAAGSSIIEKPAENVASDKIKAFYLYLNDKEPTGFEKDILENDAAQTYLKFFNHDKDKTYLFTASGDHGGSANYRNIRTKLYQKNNGNYKLILDKMEVYSTDPGFDSNYFTERFKLWIYKVFKNDKRYL